MTGYGPADCMIVFGLAILFGIVGLILIDKGVV